MYRKDDRSLPAYAFPGGYPLYYTDSYNEVLCPACARGIEADPEAWDEERPVYQGTHYEGPPLICDSGYSEDCFGEIESAYGDPWAE